MEGRGFGYSLTDCERCAKSGELLPSSLLAVDGSAGSFTM